ncbi:MAG: hypothetical protein LBT12_04900 [Oscillospiraceae bacterium]|nr:hypothetical protein [Oscillospiraceae bacterium]
MRRVITIGLCIAALAALAGCASILEGEKLTVTPHAETVTPIQQGNALEASSYEELRGAFRELILRHELKGSVNAYGYEGDVEADVRRACFELAEQDPIGAYAVSEMNAAATQIVSYYEIEVDIAYRRTREQTDAIVTASTLRYLKSELLDMISGYREDAAILTTLNITEAEVQTYIREAYYENPLRIVMMPITTVAMFPPNGQSRVIELTFGQRNAASVLRAYGEWLTQATRDIAESVSGDNDGEILLALCTRLTDLAEYDAASAELTEFSPQNLSATAYGALNGSATGEGYAMAYKALCDELDLECYVVLGTRGGVAHAWNIIACDGAYYHVDAALCDVNGIETAFLRSDADMETEYAWDRAQYKVCDGELTYADFAETEETLGEGELETDADTEEPPAEKPEA